MSSEQDPSKQTGMRALGEQDRSPEYKQARDSFVDSVNGMLDCIEERQQEGGTLEIVGGYHFPISEDPRITATFMGDTPHTRSFVESKKPGVSLTGDGKFEPRTLQIVLPDQTTIQITGTNPMLPRDDEGNYTRKSRSDGDFARVSIDRTVTSDDNQQRLNETYVVLGDGTMSNTGGTLHHGDKHMSYDERGIFSATTGKMVIDELTQSWGLNS